VPNTRGRESSRNAEDILNEIKMLAQTGVSEITLLGQNVNAYHGLAPNKSTTWNLAQLLYAIADIQEIQRIFYTSSHPRDVTMSLAKAHSEIPTLMPFLHLPVQSGSNAILRKMKRAHTIEEYVQWIETFRKHTPNMAFSSDFIVGFPGESKADFEQTLELVRQIKFAQAFSFKYSQRPGTPASTMPNQIPEETKKTRLQALQELLQQQQTEFNKGCIGQVLSVMFHETGKRERQILGKSEYMQSVVVSDVEPEQHIHGIRRVAIRSATLSSLEGIIV
jgi:tRNA-2-methylthio-N6-dimethylallyladenosine synthase